MAKLRELGFHFGPRWIAFTMSSREAPPRAGAMLESLRGLGYTVGAALADIVDNSISAGATEIDVGLSWADRDSRIWVLDNGRGMSDPELQDALTLGAKNPKEARDATDLGRFGLGLKTASFSQCKRLTVASKKNGAVSCLRWDLDALEACPDRWLMLEGPHPGSEPWIDKLACLSSGTIVLWENLDRIVTAAFGIDDFADLADDVELHLAMVFHRLIGGARAGFRLRINDRVVKPWDPFMDGHPSKTWGGYPVKLNTPFGTLEAEGHVLPHRDMLSPEEFHAAQGPAGWTAQQGFYVYRNRRLLLAGGWLGLGDAGKPWNREEQFRLARIRLDLPNTADADWKIDIKKSTARVPVSVRPWLTKIAVDTRDRARKVFAFRGAPTGPGREPVATAWRSETTRGGTCYRIDLKHPAVAAALDASGSGSALLKAMIRVLEETVPVQRIWLDTAEQKEVPRGDFAGEPPEAVIEVARVLFDDLRERKGLDVHQARKSLLRTEPFQKYPALVASLGE